MAVSIPSMVVALVAALPLVSADTGAMIFKDRSKRQATCAASVESCSTAAATATTCCVNRPGGQFLQVQFWDTDPVEGPANSWGIHGLWPDNCDGTYSEDCDTSREYTDITTLIEKYGTTELLDNMNTYWNSNDESNEDFWENEWAEHGTCVTTLDPTCYTDYETGEEAVDFFQIVVDLFLSLNTYEVLYAAGIIPSSTKTYTSAEIISAISASFGQDPVLLCTDDTIESIYYGFFIDGPILNQDFVPAVIVGEDTTCPDSGISYPPKVKATTTVATTTAASTASTSATSTGKVTTTTVSTSTTSTRKITLPGGKTSTTTTSATTTSSAATATGSSISGEGYFYVYYDGSEAGELISEGTWYVGGTPATYHATATTGGFTIYTSKGDCDVTDGAFACGSDVSSGTFSLNGGLLAYDGSTAFYASEIPTGDEQAAISATSGSYSVTFEWSAI